MVNLKLHGNLTVENYLKTYGTAMGTKVADSFANIFRSAVETNYQ